MAPSYTMIAKLTPQTANAVLFVRVTRIWEATNTKTNQRMHTNVILVDQEDSHILAMVRKDQRDHYIPLLAEGSVYIISNFKVVSGPKFYRSVSNDLSVNLFYKTKIELIGDTETIPRYKFDLRNFDDIAGLVNNNKNFIDVIGMVVSFGGLETRANRSKKMDIVLVNSSNEIMIVTLWEKNAFQFQEALASTDGRAAFIAITGLSAKTFYECATLSSGEATRCYINIEYTPLNKLRDAVCYEVTNNKIQAQTVKHVGLYLPKPVFNHGQLYVAIPRLTSPIGLGNVCVGEAETLPANTANLVHR